MDLSRWAHQSSGNGMVDGYLDDWEPPLTKEQQFTPVHDPAIQAAVDAVWERIMVTQPLLETILSMPIDQIGRLKKGLYEDLEEWKEEWV